VFLKIFRQVESKSCSAQAITGKLVPKSLLPQTRDLLLGEVLQSGGRKVPGGRIDNVVVKRVTKREKLRDLDRLLATYCTLLKKFNHTLIFIKIPLYQ
jgi:hypothetical protein